MPADLTTDMSFAISVPIGSYHPRLRDCLASLAAQTPRPRVALMDASGDERVSAIADEFEDLLTVRRHGPDEGQADAIANGWEALEGEVLGWLNADDVLLPGALSAAVEAFASSPEADVVYGRSEIVDERGAFTGYHWGVAAPGGASLRTNCFISQPSCFFRRSLCDRVGGLNRSLHFTMDWDLWVRFEQGGARFAFIDDVLSSVLWTREAKTGGFGKARRDELNAIIGEHPQRLGRLKAQIGFAMHHVLEYMLPASWARAVRRAKTAKPEPQYGIDWCGDVVSSAQVPLYHFRPSAACGVTVCLAGRAEGLSASIDGVSHPIEASANGEGLEIALLEPLQPGVRKTLSLSPGQGASLCVTGVRLKGL